MTIDILGVSDTDKVSICAYDTEGAWENPRYSEVDKKEAEKVIEDIKKNTTDEEILETWTALI